MKVGQVSIVLTCFNDHLYLQEAINSALTQTYDNKEIILVDDGSDYRTKEKIKTLESEVDVLITQMNKGVSAARNSGIEAATGEFILVLDSDDHFEPQFAEKAVEILKKDLNIKLVTCYSNWFDRNNSRLYKPEGGSAKNVLLKNIAMGSAMFRKQDWKLNGGYDEKMKIGYEDWEFYIRLLKNAGSVFVIPEVLFNYRNTENSRNKKASSYKYEILEYIFNKHSELYKENFSFFIHEWLLSIKKSEAFKQQVMQSLDYKVGNKLLKPFRFFGIFKKR